MTENQPRACINFPTRSADFSQQMALLGEEQWLYNPPVPRNLEGLGISPGLVTDLVPTFYPTELREIDVRLAELPPVQDQMTDLSAKVDTLQLKSAAQDQNIAALKTERTALFLYASQLHDHYARAYALAQPHVSLFLRIITFGAKKQKKLNLPAPEAIPVPAQ